VGSHVALVEFDRLFDDVADRLSLGSREARDQLCERLDGQTPIVVFGGNLQWRDVLCALTETRVVCAAKDTLVATFNLDDLLAVSMEGSSTLEFLSREDGKKSKMSGVRPKPRVSDVRDRITALLGAPGSEDARVVWSRDLTATSISRPKVEVLLGELAAGERVLMAADCRLGAQQGPAGDADRAVARKEGGQRGVLICTDQRALFLVSRTSGGGARSYPLTMIDSVSYDDGISGDVRLLIDGNEVRFTDMSPRERAHEIADSINEQRVARTADAAAGESTEDPVDTIERLARLRDIGVITVDEFEAKKAELLDRI